MKTRILITLISLLAFTLNAQTDKHQMETALTNYIKAGDENNASSLQTYLHPTFRVSLYDKAKDKISTLDRDTYINFIDTKKFGGYPRTINIQSIQHIGNHMATIQVTLTSPNKPTLKNFYSLVKEQGKWLVLQDYVILIP